MRYLGTKVQGPVAWRNIGPGLCFNSPVSVGVLRPSGLAPPLPVRVSLRPLPCCEGWQEWPAGCAPGQHQRQGRQEPGEEGEQMSCCLLSKCAIDLHSPMLIVQFACAHEDNIGLCRCAGGAETLSASPPPPSARLLLPQYL